METKFTKGEWVVRPKAMGGVMEKDSERTIANCMCYSSNINQELIYQENIANAKLIAAAPEMYEALAETDKDLCVLETTMRQIELTDKRAEGMVELVIKWRERNKQVLKKATE